jgi:hypothetical protein
VVEPGFSEQPRAWDRRGPACGINTAPRVGSARPRVTVHNPQLNSLEKSQSAFGIAGAVLSINMWLPEPERWSRNRAGSPRPSRPSLIQSRLPPLFPFKIKSEGGFFQPNSLVAAALQDSDPAGSSAWQWEKPPLPPAWLFCWFRSAEVK